MQIVRDERKQGNSKVSRTNMMRDREREIERERERSFFVLIFIDGINVVSIVQFFFFFTMEITL